MAGMAAGGAQTAVVDALDMSALAAALRGTLFDQPVQHFQEIGSTNTFAMQAGAAGAVSGTVYVADAQTGGRGRGAHSWASPAGSGLYVSVLLRPTLSPGDALWLSLAAGLAAQAAVQAVAGFVPDLRWPNDLLVGRRKLGGVLTEMQAEATRVRFVVIGIGINVHQAAFGGELAEVATSLCMEAPETAKQLQRTRLLIALLRALEREVEALTGTAAEAARVDLLSRLEAGSSWVRGKRVVVGEDAGCHVAPYGGVTAGLDARGFLQVLTDEGEMRTVLSGGVRAQE